ncbi:MAG: PEP-CTERM sorting domain-containing protein [Nitrosospira sp.]|nr:PEP-CTERM sorting domain-containing protein [Nitrosospira sp.]
MKMNFRLKALAAATIMATSMPLSAAMDGADSGNGSLLVNFRSYVGSPTSGNNDISAVFDLGVNMNDVIGWNGTAGFNRTWDLSTGLMSGTGISGSQAIGSYGGTWNDLFNGVAAADQPKIEYSVMALDNTDKTIQGGGSRYLTTANVTNFPSLPNANLNGFDNMNLYVNANNSRGTHATEANGASIATPTDDPNSYFAAINGFGQGDNWLTKTTADTTKTLDTEQSFWYLATSSLTSHHQAIKTPFGVDLNGDGIMDANEFSKWSVNADAGTISFAAPIPEAQTWAMMLAGLGMIGMMVRRRVNV